MFKVGDRVSSLMGTEGVVTDLRLINTKQAALVQWECSPPEGLAYIEDLELVKEQPKIVQSGTIQSHEGSKYLRTIHPASDCAGEPIQVDVYETLIAWNVTCPALAHCCKKVLCAGQRGKGDRLADLKGALAALNRAIELETRRTKVTKEIS